MVEGWSGCSIQCVILHRFSQDFHNIITDHHGKEPPLALEKNPIGVRFH